MNTASKTTPKLMTRLHHAYRHPGPARAAWVIVLALALAWVLIGSARAETAVEQTGAVVAAVAPPVHEARTPSILTALERTKRYPDAAYTSHKSLDGRAIVTFDVDDGGHPQHIELVHRSGNGAFDRQTVESVRSAVCAECSGKSYRITYDYHLQ
ncbi:MAG TPA: TonB family protein [Acetobacteraceae bacterium]|nr:TonB family protein [Acetobacteraceae bacterium]